MASFSQCSTAQKLQKNSPTEFGEVYYQTWTSGIKNGGSGINIFIPIKNPSVTLDSVFFRGKSTKLEVKPNVAQLYIGRFKTDKNQPKDIVLSSEPKEEYENEISIKDIKTPFELKDDECVVSYKKGDATLYYKISKIIEKTPMNLPSAPPNKQ